MNKIRLSYFFQVFIMRSFICLSTLCSILISFASGAATKEKGETGEERHNIRVKRGNYGERYSGGIGSGSSLGVGYGGTAVAGGHFSGVTGPQVVFDSIALKAVSGANNAFVQSYQAQINAASSSGQGLDYAQQQGQHQAAYAGLAANQVGQWYNAIATGPVSPVYKGEYRR